MADPTGRVPAGVMVRPAPDWFDELMAFGGYSFDDTIPDTECYVNVGLYNNGSAGTLLRVYGLSCYADSDGAFVMYPLFGTGGFCPLGPGFPLRFDKQQVIGSLYWKVELVSPPAPNPIVPPTNAATVATPNSGGAAWFTPFPVAVIPAGWMLVIANAASALFAGVGLWWQPSDV